MIDSNFVIRYTDALYAAPVNCLPRYDEFRDMFSSGQLKSKEWAISELSNLNLQFHSASIMGCWFGTLGLMLKNAYPKLFLELVDIDPRCEEFNKYVFRDIPFVYHHTLDMYDWDSSEDLVINTGCEHINDIADWLSPLDEGTTVLLQSNNYFEGNGHINCSDTLDDFINKTKLENILYSGELVMPMYTRYMIIGYT